MQNMSANAMYMQRNMKHVHVKRIIGTKHTHEITCALNNLMLCYYLPLPHIRVTQTQAKVLFIVAKLIKFLAFRLKVF